MVIRARDHQGFGRLQVLTDPDGPHRVLDVVDAALAAGVPTVQVRAKAGTDRRRLTEIEAIVTRCGAVGATCIVNDRLDLALAAGARGVHLGHDDLPVRAARRLAPELMIGATVRTVDEACAAEVAGASYVGVGPVFATETKRLAVDPLGVEVAGEIARSVTIPSVAIAGITVDTVTSLLAHGVTGIAVVGAVSHTDDPAAACTALLDRIESTP